MKFARRDEALAEFFDNTILAGEKTPRPKGMIRGGEIERPNHRIPRTKRRRNRAKRRSLPLRQAHFRDHFWEKSAK
jgi:hypothetical protein